MGQIAFKFLVGAGMGLLAWMVMEPTKPGLGDPSWPDFEIRLLGLLGVLVGLGIGGVNGYLRGSRFSTATGAILGAVLGGVGALVGYAVGGNLARAFFGKGIFDPPYSWLTPVARTVVGAGLGLGIGLAIGASGLTLKRVIQGLIGGLLGGALGGALFDSVSQTLGAPIAMVSGEAEIGGPGRAALCVLIGAGVGLLIGVVERVSRVAWIRLRLGPKEGKEWVLDQQTTHIGRDERAGVPLFGDPNVIPLHVSIVRQGDTYWIYDAGSPIGTGLNGVRLDQPMPLQSGAIIGVGSFQLEFMLRAGSAPAKAAEKMRGPIVAPQIPIVLPPASAVSVVALNGPAAGQRFLVDRALEVGREGRDIRIEDPQMSRRHSLIEPEASAAKISDLASTNGTFVNGRRISIEPLKPGDEIMIGTSRFRVE